MTLLRYKYALRRGERLLNTHSLVESKPKQRDGHVVFLRPPGKALSPSVVLDEHLPSCASSVSKPRRNGECIMYSPSVPEPPRQVGCAKSDLFGPCADVLRLSIERYQDVRRYVGLLNLWRCPPTILRVVAKLSINSVKGGSGWSNTHVREEVLERRSPSFADQNPFCPIRLELRISRVMAPANHRAVTCVGRALRCLRGVPMFLRHNFLQACNELIVQPLLEIVVARFCRRAAERELCLKGVA